MIQTSVSLMTYKQQFDGKVDEIQKKIAYVFQRINQWNENSNLEINIPFLKFITYIYRFNIILFLIL